MNTLHNLARAAGIEIEWRDVYGRDHMVGDDSLRAVLAAIGFPAATPAQISESLGVLRNETERNILPLVTATVGERVTLSGAPGHFRLTLDSGAVLDGIARENAGGIELPAISEPGYHRLELGGHVTTIAVAPRRAFTLAQAAQGRKLWGLTLQLYALRRDGDGGIGDFAALEAFARHAAASGAAAIAISPVHALFSADPTRYSPYAPSSRAALNALHIAEDTAVTDQDGLINWAQAAPAKLAALRAAFNAGHDEAGLQSFRAQAGTGLMRHAIFEALAETFTRTGAATTDWRRWPAAYQDPDHQAVERFGAAYRRDVDFYLWLQWQASQGMAAAQRAARAAGAPIGLIADLAVGTDPAGSHSWSRQNEVLRGLEIGCPPDLINRAGQSWGITAFSPRGLRNSGFAAFIEMLRNALAHAGGVRIDHAMGLTRLWVIPYGMSSAEGAYLSMPSADLLRLVTLESQRHRAVILGEDLGTLPPGFGARLDEAGIAGLRVLWFERDGTGFARPASWTPAAAAMTSTHDLPTIAGWWRGRDIALRAALNMEGDDAATREAERAALWSAFQASGAATGPEPAIAETAAVADAAAAHIGLAACELALLPIEDALGLVEQPNLPGTTTEHPNWRRRLPGDAQTLFTNPDLTRRLATLKAARES